MYGNRTESSWRYRGWRVAAASAAGVFASFGSLLVFTFGVFLKPIATEFGWSREAVSFAFAFAALMVAVCSPGIGALLDRYGPRRVILPCVAVFGSALVALSLLPAHIVALYAVFLVMGAVGNGTAQLAHSRAVATWFATRRGMALAVVMTGSAIGAMVWPPVAQALIDHEGWRTAVATLGVLALAIGFVAAGFFVRDNPDHRRGKRPVSSGSALRLAWSRPFLIIVVILFLGSLGQNGAIIHLSAMLTDRGVPAGGAAVAISAMGAASLLGRIAAGYLLDRFFAPRVAMWLLAVAAAGAYAVSSAQTTAAGVLGSVLIGIGMGAEADITPYLLSRYFGLESFGALYGMSWTAYAIAGAVGPVLMGRAFDLTGSYTAFLAGLSGLMLAAALLTLALPAYEAAPARLPATEFEPATD